MHNQTLNENAIVVQSAKRRSFETDNFRTQSFGRFTLTDKLVCIDKLYNLNIIAYSINTKRAHKKTAEQRTIVQQYGDWYACRWWVTVTFGTAKRGLGGLGPRPVPSSLYEM